MTKGEIAVILINGPLKMDMDEAKAVAARLVDPEVDRMFKYAILIGMGIDTKAASYLS